VRRKRLTLLLAAFALVAAFSYVECNYLPLPGKFGSGEVKVLLVGDSITYSLGVYPFMHSSGYPRFLSDVLGDGYEVSSYALSGAEVRRDGRKPFSRFPISKAFLKKSYDIAVVMLGSNDAKEDFPFDKEGFLAILQSIDAKRVVVLLPPPSYSKKISNENLEKNVRPAISELCKENRIECHDTKPIFDGGGLYVDGIHPNKAGCKELALFVSSLIL